MMAPLLKDLGIDRFFIQVLGIRGKPAKSHDTKSRDTKSHDKVLQVPISEWLSVIPDSAEKIADLGITVTYPKVFLRPEEPFECAGLVAENYFIFPNGRVYRCPLCEDYPLHSMIFKDNKLVKTGKINENDFFGLKIPEGCVMNKVIQPDNLKYTMDGAPEYKIACCLLKEEISRASAGPASEKSFSPHRKGI